MVIECLQLFKLYAKLENCLFDQTEVEFLGYKISSQGISLDPSKVDTLLSWSQPKSVHDVQSFLGFVNFYHIFIDHFSSITIPLNQLTHKPSKPFIWNNSVQKSFGHVKKAVTSAPILVHVNPSCPFIIKTDASDFAFGAILSQYQD